MLETCDPADLSPVIAEGETLDERIRRVPAIAAIVAEAEVTWRARAAAAGHDDQEARPGWRTFEDAFPTFYEFTNRPR